MRTQSIKSELIDQMKNAKIQLEISKKRQRKQEKHEGRELYFPEYLTMREQRFLLGTMFLANSHQEFSTDDLVMLMGNYPAKFENLIDLVFFEPNMVEILRSYGYFYVCDNIIKDRIIKEELRNYQKGV